MVDYVAPPAPTAGAACLDASTTARALVIPPPNKTPEEAQPARTPAEAKALNDQQADALRSVDAFVKKHGRIETDTVGAAAIARGWPAAPAPRAEPPCPPTSDATPGVRPTQVAGAPARVNAWAAVDVAGREERQSARQASGQVAVAGARMGASA